MTSFLAFHLFGYAGGTAFNSCYDRDEGPIGGLEHPPPVPKHLLEFSLVWQLAGFVLALGVNYQFAAIYALMFCLSVAYSHPRVRLKSKPLFALATVAVGQGVLAFLGGWSAGHGDVSGIITQVGMLGMTAATLLTVGLYPLTQVYQLEEDTRRGDRTFAIALGSRGSFRWAFICIALGGAAAAWLVASRFSNAEGIGLLVFVGVLLAWLRAWAIRFDRSSVSQNYHSLMKVYAATSLPFFAWITLHLVAG